MMDNNEVATSTTTTTQIDHRLDMTTTEATTTTSRTGLKVIVTVDGVARTIGEVSKPTISGEMKGETTGEVGAFTRDRANFGWRREDVKQRIRAFTLIQAAADETPELVKIELLLNRDEMRYLYSSENNHQESLAFDVPKIVQT